MRTTMIAASFILVMSGAQATVQAATFSAWGHEFTYPNTQDVEPAAGKSFVAIQQSGGRRGHTSKPVKLSHL